MGQKEERGVDSTAIAVRTEGVGENDKQSENFAFIVAEGTRNEHECAKFQARLPPPTEKSPPR